MTSYNRAQTINSLAMAMGVKPVSSKDMARYNSASGTFYCKDNSSDSNNIDSAIAYFENLKKSALRSLSSESQMIAGYYTSAIEALKFFQQKTAEDTNKPAV